MSKKKSIYQFKISLLNIEPPIWRRIQVPEDYNFYELHVAIQDAMGWYDCHLHAFRVKDPLDDTELLIGIPDDEGFGPPFLPGWEIPIEALFTESNSIAQYDYDFGDDWQHEVVLEKVMPKESKVKYPICICGERACPPEDCGGSWGYEEFLEAYNNPDHERHEDMVEWAGKGFDAEEFNPLKVKFDNPKKRFMRLFDESDPF